MLRVDHASLRVASLARAFPVLREALGFWPTPSPTAPDRHSRLFFHRSYLEVSEGEAPGMELFFFGFEALDVVESHLRQRGLRYRSEPYFGVDGVWDNLELEPPSGVPAPILVRRISPPALAGTNWPPPRPLAWPCGATALRGFRLRVASFSTAAPFFEALLQTQFHSGRARWPGGELALIEGAPGIDAVCLQTASLEETASFFLRHQGLHGVSVADTPTGLEVTVGALPGLRLLFAA